jgi:hypothetical protein
MRNYDSEMSIPFWQKEIFSSSTKKRSFVLLIAEVPAIPGRFFYAVMRKQKCCDVKIVV